MKRTPKKTGRVSHFHLLKATVWLTLAFTRAAWYFKNRALRDLALPHPETLSSKEKRRLKHYFYGTTYLSVVFCMIRNRIRTHREKHLFTNLAALTYFFDDLVDAFRESDDSGVIWQDNPEQYGQMADPRGLALHFLHNIYEELPPADLAEFKNIMHEVFNIETAGRQQSSKILDLNALEKITADKGGYSVLLFRRLLSNPILEPEHDALYQAGYLIQLCDDIFDLWFDRQADIRTIPIFFAEVGQIEKLIQFFENQITTTKNLFGNIAPSTSPPLMGGPGGGFFFP